MQIKEMFRKEIDRELQGVIVVGQGAETNVAQELEEYVVTRELVAEAKVALETLEKQARAGTGRIRRSHPNSKA